MTATRAERRRTERRIAKGYGTRGYPIATEDDQPATISAAEQLADANLTRLAGTARRSPTRFLRYGPDTRAHASTLLLQDTDAWFADHPNGWLIVAICDVHTTD